MDRFRQVPPTGPIGTAGPAGVPVNPGAPGAGETKRFVFSGREGAVQAGLEHTREALRSWSWLPTADEERLGVAEDLLLMVAELVANACLHTSGGPGELRLRWDGRRLRAEVTDTSPVPPELRPYADPGRPGGHGLRVVERLAGSWGCAPEGGGKVVWLEIGFPPGPPNHRECSA